MPRCDMTLDIIWDFRYFYTVIYNSNVVFCAPKDCITAVFDLYIHISNEQFSRLLSYITFSVFFLEALTV